MLRVIEERKRARARLWEPPSAIAPRLSLDRHTADERRMRRRQQELSPTLLALTLDPPVPLALTASASPWQELGKQMHEDRQREQHELRAALEQHEELTTLTRGAPPIVDQPCLGLT